MAGAICCLAACGMLEAKGCMPACDRAEVSSQQVSYGQRIVFIVTGTKLGISMYQQKNFVGCRAGL